MSPLPTMTNGRNVRKPVRVALSIAPIASKSAKPAVNVRPPAAPSRLRIVVIDDDACSRAEDQNRGCNAQADARDDEQRRAPGHDDQECGNERGNRHLADVARKIVGSERCARTCAFECVRDQVRRDRVLYACTESSRQRARLRSQRTSNACSQRRNRARQAPFPRRASSVRRRVRR